MFSNMGNSIVRDVHANLYYCHSVKQIYFRSQFITKDIDTIILYQCIELLYWGLPYWNYGNM